jgi:hypothetical protein
MTQLRRKQAHGEHRLTPIHWTRGRESFHYAREIEKPFGVIETVLNWCKTEIRGDWRWQLVEISSDRKPGRYCFFFDEEKDYCAFLMKWA